MLNKHVATPKLYIIGGGIYTEPPPPVVSLQGESSLALNHFALYMKCLAGAIQVSKYTLLHHHQSIMINHQSSNIQKTGKNICVTLRVRIFSAKHLSLSFVSSTLALILNLILITNHSLVHSASSEHGRLCDCNAGRTSSR